MTGGWSSKPEWPKLTDTAAMEEIAAHGWPEEVLEFDKAMGDTQLHGIGFTQDGKHVSLEKVYNNRMPTHDPYTNPNAQVYYECKCGAILDPGTKSFASLNNAASDKGWKVRWKQNGEGYEPFCVECGKDVE